MQNLDLSMAPFAFDDEKGHQFLFHRPTMGTVWGTAGAVKE